MRADPRSGKGHEHMAGQCVLGLGADAFDAAHGEHAAGRLAAAEKEVGVKRYRPYKFSWDAVGRDLCSVTGEPGVRGNARACVVEAASPRQVNRCSNSAVASISAAS